MIIKLNDIEVEPIEGETILETARRVGLKIPSMCYSKEAKHKASCMVCAVKNMANGQIIPSCTTTPVEGMSIDTECDEVKSIRRLSLELLLSDHKADCEAPCVMVCPKGLNIERMLYFYDKGNMAKAKAVVSGAFDLSSIGCDDCKVPCEKVCRRGTIDHHVEIRAIIKEIVATDVDVVTPDKTAGTNKSLYHSRLGRFTTIDKERLKESVTATSRCLHCACAGRDKCKLRFNATDAGINTSRYDATSAMTLMKKEKVTEKMWFEAAKCIRCGLCVYNSNNGFTFKNRGFIMEICIPEENKKNVDDSLASICPTGALYLEE